MRTKDGDMSASLPCSRVRVRDEKSDRLIRGIHIRFFPWIPSHGFLAMDSLGSFTTGMDSCGFTLRTPHIFHGFV